MENAVWFNPRENLKRDFGHAREEAARLRLAASALRMELRLTRLHKQRLCEALKRLEEWEQAFQ